MTSTLTMALCAALSAAPLPEGLFVRAGALHLRPLPQSGEVVLSGVSGPAALAVSDGPVAGSSVGMSAATLPAVTIGYRFGEQLGVETILAAPITVKLVARGTLASQSLAPRALDTLPTGVPALGPTLGEAQVLPPVLTLTWRFLPEQRVRPYVGAGVNYLVTLSARITNPVLTEVREPRLDIQPGFGFVAQVGTQVQLWQRLNLFIDAKYIAGLKVRATMTDMYVRVPELPLYDEVRVGDATVDVAINPLVLSAGVGWDF